MVDDARHLRLGRTTKDAEGPLDAVEGRVHLCVLQAHLGEKHSEHLLAKTTDRMGGPIATIPEERADDLFPTVVALQVPKQKLRFIVVQVDDHFGNLTFIVGILGELLEKHLDGANHLAGVTRVNVVVPDPRLVLGPVIPPVAAHCFRDGILNRFLDGFNVIPSLFCAFRISNPRIRLIHPVVALNEQLFPLGNVALGLVREEDDVVWYGFGSPIQRVFPDMGAGSVENHVMDSKLHVVIQPVVLLQQPVKLLGDNVCELVGFCYRVVNGAVSEPIHLTEKIIERCLRDTEERFCFTVVKVGLVPPSGCGQLGLFVWRVTVHHSLH